MPEDPSLAGRHVVVLTWRDTGNPEAGGAERYLEQMVRGLVDRGCQVTVFTAGYPGAPPDELEGGVRSVRRGSKISVYATGMWLLLTRRLGRPDLVVDVQNGLPFFTPLVTRCPVVVLVHHVHREQWPIVYPGLIGRVGWFLESRIAPLLYRGREYVAVSRATRADLVTLGVREPDVAVVHNGAEPAVRTTGERALHPMICVVGRLVPHKRVELAIDTVAALAAELPDLRLHVVGDGWWRARLHEHAAARGVTERVVFEGHVSAERLHRVYEESWLMLLPSVKEGWGLVVGEAGQHGTPTIAFAEAGGPTESIADGDSGMLVHDSDAMVRAARGVLTDPDQLTRLSEGARRHSAGFTWAQSQRAFSAVLASVLSGQHPPEVDA